MASPLTVVLTGGNKGIGFAIAQSLLAQSASTPVILYLTARSVALGEQAIAELLSSTPPAPGSDVRFHQLDITSASSISALAADLKRDAGAIDVLINNAGILPSGELSADLAKQVVRCNYDGTKAVTFALLPLINPGGRVVNVSSTGGTMRNLPSPALRARFLDAQLTVEKLDVLMRKFEQDVALGQWKEEGWPENAYRVSKMGMTGFSSVLAKENPGILVNACCPGWVKTDMAPMGTKTPEEGARTPALLAVGDIGGRTGRFWRDGAEVPWTEGVE
ncbi:oxidoreductase [Calocera cornea HHB12733]|uniref:Oxidoreductase n=1 Tax=Calocera cornea HHB12733 TaxID=1353952 RepID=A0A165HUL6_9BASI|nr:oxidoreductase [Calocera cornea HHB12733]